MIFFSIDKQRDKVNVERMSRPIDSIKIIKPSIARLGLDICGAVTYFCFSAEKKFLSGLIIGGAYTSSQLEYLKSTNFCPTDSVVMSANKNNIIVPALIELMTHNVLL